MQIAIEISFQSTQLLTSDKRLIKDKFILFWSIQAETTFCHNKEKILKIKNWFSGSRKSNSSNQTITNNEMIFRSNLVMDFQTTAFKCLFYYFDWFGPKAVWVGTTASLPNVPGDLLFLGLHHVWLILCGQLRFERC